jgi:hypothetical protein
MSIFIIFMLLFIVGTILVAHHMGTEYGYEHGYNDARREIEDNRDTRIRNTR